MGTCRVRPAYAGVFEIHCAGPGRKLALFYTLVPVRVSISGPGPAPLPVGPGQIGFVSHKSLQPESRLPGRRQIGFVLYNRLRPEYRLLPGNWELSLWCKAPTSCLPGKLSDETWYRCAESNELASRCYQFTIIRRFSLGRCGRKKPESPRNSRGGRRRPAGADRLVLRTGCQLGCHVLQSGQRRDSTALMKPAVRGCRLRERVAHRRMAPDLGSGATVSDVPGGPVLSQDRR
jgi:hypothetical protein